MSRPPALEGSSWAEWALVSVALGLVDSWTPSGGEWDGGAFDVALWGESYLTPNRWIDVTADIESIDVDTGRNGVDDPGDVATCSVLLYDPAGAYAIAGTSTSAIGNLLRVVTEWRAGGVARSVFHGVVQSAKATGDLSAPSTSIKAVDLLGALVSTDDTVPLPAQSVTERIAMMLDRASVPGELRDLADDPTALIPVDHAGNRLDAARGAAASSVGGSILAMGDGTIRYRFGAFMYEPQAPLALEVGTVEGAICPSSLDLTEDGADVLNIYDWTTSDRDTPLSATGEDLESVRRFGRHSSVRTDLLNADVDQLRALVTSEVARTSWSPERVDGCSIPVHDDSSAAAVVVQVGDLIGFTYTGSSPWSARQLLGGYSHHISPDEWTVDIRAYPAIESTPWDSARFDVDTWSLGAVLESERVT